MSIVKSDVWKEVRVESPLNGDQPLFALLGYGDIQTLEGRLLTIVDASFSDGQQRKAFKDLVRQAIWWHWVPELDTDPSEPDGGMPFHN